jgi:heme oxygenase (biliverdin-IX-beta and delta-forming)
MSDLPQEPSQRPAALARRLIRGHDRAMLATALADGGYPYGSLVLVACDLDGSPLLLLSALAEHARNLARESRASLLFDGTIGLDDPLTGARVTVLGEIATVADEAARARFLRRHPSAQAYADFKDFALYRMRLARAHLVAGFGRIHWIGTSDLLYPYDPSDWPAGTEATLIEQLTSEYSSILDLCVNRLGGAIGAGWRITGVDPEGADFRRGGAVARLHFATVAPDPARALQAFAAFAQLAQKRVVEG